LKRKQQKEIIVDNDVQDEANLKRCKRPRGNNQAVHLESTRACQKQTNMKSTPKELSKQRQVSNKWIIFIMLIIFIILIILIVLNFLKQNLKIPQSQKQKALKSTAKKLNKQEHVSNK
jgi:uncharacterized membrane protein YvbJ